MKLTTTISAFFLALLLLNSCTSSSEIELFNGEDLDNWSAFISDDTPAESVFWVEDGVINVA